MHKHDVITDFEGLSQLKYNSYVVTHGASTYPLWDMFLSVVCDGKFYEQV